MASRIIQEFLNPNFPSLYFYAQCLIFFLLLLLFFVIETISILKMAAKKAQAEYNSTLCIVLLFKGLCFRVEMSSPVGLVSYTQDYFWTERGTDMVGRGSFGQVRFRCRLLSLLT